MTTSMASRFESGFRALLQLRFRRYVESTLSCLSAVRTGFQVNASSLLHHNGGLVVAEWIFHRGSEQLLDKCPSLREVMAVVRDVQFADGRGQRYYNEALSNYFVLWGWARESRVIPNLPLKCDFI